MWLYFYFKCGLTAIASICADLGIAKSYRKISLIQVRSPRLGSDREGWKGATPPTQKFRTLFKILKKHSMSGIQALNNFSFESESLEKRTMWAIF